MSREEFTLYGCIPIDTLQNADARFSEELRKLEEYRALKWKELKVIDTKSGPQPDDNYFDTFIAENSGITERAARAYCKIYFPVLLEHSPSNVFNLCNYFVELHSGSKLFDEKLVTASQLKNKMAHIFDVEHRLAVGEYEKDVARRKKEEVLELRASKAEVRANIAIFVAVLAALGTGITAYSNYTRLERDFQKSNNLAQP